MSKSSPGAVKLWGAELAERFFRMPIELLIHHADIGLGTQDFIVILWIAFHQWSAKPAFPHPVKLAFVLKMSEGDAVRKLHELRDRGYIALEPTVKNSRNFHQDIRPTINRLRNFLADNPNHCEVIKRKSDNEGIDASSNRNSSLTDTSNSIDTSIPLRGGTSSIGDVFNKRSENK